MKAYKLVRQRKDGSLASLFINKKDTLVFDEWLNAEDHPTDGYAHRPGWHCTFIPHAPHLTMRDRVWVEVDVNDYEVYERPVNQGGKWILAQRMKVNKTLDKGEVDELCTNGHGS